MPKCLASCFVPEVRMGQALNVSVGTQIKHGESMNVRYKALLYDCNTPISYIIYDLFIR